MIIDWYTIIFQIINFLILVFLLRRFLYGPITKAMADRKAKIIQREVDAAAMKEEASAEALSYRKKIEELEERDSELKDKAVETAEEEKNRLMEIARKEIDDKRKRWYEELAREKETMGIELRRRIGEQATSIASKCLKDLTAGNGEQLNTLIWKGFIEKLKDLPDEETMRIKDALSGNNNPVNINTSFTLSEDNLQELKSLLKSFMPDPEAEINIHVKNDPGLICGLEINTGGYTINRSVDYYLKDVEARILKELDRGESVENVGEVS